MDYNDLIYNQAGKYRKSAAKKFSIPLWADYFWWIEYKWENSTEYEAVSPKYLPELNVIEKEIYYAWNGDKCYRIEKLVLREMIWTVRTGTVKAILRINQKAMRDAWRKARLLYIRALTGALADYADPTNTAIGGAIEIGLILKGFKTMGLPGAIADAKSISDLLGKANEITDEMLKILKEIARLQKLDGTVIATYKNVVWHRGSSGRYRTTVMHEEIKEIPCTREIKALPEGHIRLFETEQIYPHYFDIDKEFEKLEKELEKQYRGKYGEELRDPGKELKVGKALMDKARKAVEVFDRVKKDSVAAKGAKGMKKQ